MTRNEAIAELLMPFRPLGPLRGPLDPDEVQAAWARTAPAGAWDAMIDLAVDPPSAEQTGSLSPEAFRFELARVLALLAAQDEPAFLERMAALLRDPIARPTVIDALSLMGTRESRALLHPLVTAADLTEKEAISLADSFAEADGSVALDLLAALRERVPGHWTAALREIDIAVLYADPQSL